MLEIHNLCSSYGGPDVLRNISLHVPAGQIVCLLGANGAGKSTTMRSINGLLKATSGQILFDGEPVLGLPAERIVERGLVQVPEGRRVFSPLSVVENLEMGGYTLLRRRQYTQYQRNKDHVLSLFPRLAERAHQAAGTLSGGEQQMLAIGRALMSSPRFLMLDEPSMGLAPLVVKDIFACLKSFKDEGLTLLVAEQNAMSTLSVSDYGYVLQEGEILLSGEVDQLRQDARVQAAYLGGGA